jgi:hypothetical protein
LGVSHKVGQLMSYWILTISGHVISATTVQRVTNAQQQTDVWKQQMNNFDSKIEERLKVQDSELPVNNIDNWN